jgi:queuosine precursor transporter
MIILVYVACVAAANIVTATTEPLFFLGFVVTWGTFFAGATFVLRDLVQRGYGRGIAYAAIGAGLAVSAAFSLVYHDALPIAVGSLVAFAVSESLDTEVFTRVPWSFSGRVVLSGLVGGLIDTALFVIIALSPLWSGILTWGQVPRAILGVYLVKAALQLIGAALLRKERVTV